MAFENEELWMQNFKAYKSYVRKFYKLPVPQTAHNGVKVGMWIHNQVYSYRQGILPENRLKLLNKFNPAWNGTSEEKQRANMDLLLNSNWMRKVPEGHTPINKFIREEGDLYACSKDGIYDCESWFAKYVGEESTYNLLCCFATIYPTIEPRYANLLCHYVLHDMVSLDELKDFFDAFSFVSSEDMAARMETILDNILNEREKNIIRLRFGLAKDAFLTYREIGLVYSITLERVRQIEHAALRKLRHPSSLVMLGCSKGKAVEINEQFFLMLKKMRRRDSVNSNAKCVNI